MSHVPVPHCARIAVTFHHTTEAVRGESTFALQDASDAIFVNPPATCTAIWTAWAARMLGSEGDQVVYDGVVFEDVRVVPYGGIEVSFGPNSGTQYFSDAHLPTDACLAVKRATSTLGRSGRGRLYMPIWNASMTSSADQVSAGAASLITARLALFQSDVEASLSPALLGHISTMHNKLVLNPGVFYHTSNWSTSDRYIDSQRRRLLGRGP